MKAVKPAQGGLQQWLIVVSENEEAWELSPCGQGLVLCSAWCSQEHCWLPTGQPSGEDLRSYANPRITITNMTGQIVVRGWDKTQVHVVYNVVSPHVEVDTEALPARRARRQDSLRHTPLGPCGFRQGPDGSITAWTFPMGTSLEIRNPQGSVRIEKFQGDDASVEIGRRRHFRFRFHRPPFAAIRGRRYRSDPRLRTRGSVFHYGKPPLRLSHHLQAARKHDLRANSL